MRFVIKHEIKGRLRVHILQLSCSIVGKGAVCLHNLVGKGRILVMLCMLGAVGVQIIMFSIRVPAVMFFIIGVACQGFD